MRAGSVAVVSLLWLLLFTSPGLAQGHEETGSSVAAVSLLPSQAVRERLDGLFQDWKAFELDLAATERAVRRTGRIQLELEGRRFDLELEPNDLRAPGYVGPEHHHQIAVLLPYGND